MFKDYFNSTKELLVDAVPLNVEITHKCCSTSHRGPFLWVWTVGIARTWQERGVITYLVGHTSVLSQESGGDGRGHPPGGLGMGVTRRRREYGGGV
jgi:hypothetical protein